MKTGSGVHSFQLNLDQRRRPTLPATLLEEAGISVETSSLVGYSDRRGRIIIEDPMAALEELGEQVLAGMRERGNTLSLLDDLLQERASDSSLGDQVATFSQDYPDGFVVDASFLVALVSLNPDAKRFAHLLKRAVTNAVNVGEVFYTTYRNSGTASAQIERAFGALGLSIDPVTIEMVRHFSDLKDVDAKRVLQQQNAGLVGPQVKKLSLGDLTCLSQGLVLGLPVLTGNKHWATLVPHGLPVAVVDFRDPQIVPQSPHSVRRA